MPHPCIQPIPTTISQFHPTTIQTSFLSHHTTHRTINIHPKTQIQRMLISVNLLTLFYSLILCFNIFFPKHSKFVKITNYKIQTIKPNKNIFQNPYMHQCYICSNLKQNLDHMELKTHQNNKYKNIATLLHQNLLLIIKTTQFLIFIQFKILPINPSQFLPMNINSNHPPSSPIQLNFMLPTMSYITFCPFYLMVTLHFCLLCPIVIIHFCP